MIDQSTVSKLTELRAQIDRAYESCGQTLDAMTIARAQTKVMAEAAPFLSSCASDLEALAGVVRLAASRAAPISETAD
jgi:hypothetical protein